RNRAQIAIEIDDVRLGVAAAAGDAETVKQRREDVERQGACELGAIHVATVRIEAGAEQADVGRRLRPCRLREGREVERGGGAARDVGIDVLVVGLKRDVALRPEVLLEVQIERLRLIGAKMRVASASRPYVVDRVEPEADIVREV